MAYYLTVFDNFGASVELESEITETASGQFTVEFEVDIKLTQGVIASGSNLGEIDSTKLIFFTSTTNLQLRIPSFANADFTLPSSANGRNVYKIVSNTTLGNIEVFQNDVSCGTKSGNAFFAISNLIPLNNTSSREVDLYYFKVFDSSGVLIHNYDPSASGGTGSILPDTAGIPANDGTLISLDPLTAWQFYPDAGGATYTINLDSGSYTYTGNDVSLAADRFILFDADSYSYAGGNVDLTASRNISLDAGAYAYTGNDLTVKANRKLSLDVGNYSYTGQDLTLVYTPDGGPTYTINLDAGSYQITGNDITLAANRAILLDSGSYGYTGQPVILAANRKLSLDAGSYAVAGDASTLLVSRKMSLDAGAYTYSGAPITLDYSGQIISLISAYSVNYANDVVKATYSTDFITARFL